MKYAQIIEVIDEINRPEKRIEWDLLAQLLHVFDKPQKKLNHVCISTSHGRSSVITYMTMILKENGYKVGSFVTPAIREYRDTLCYQGKSISKADFSKLCERLWAAVEGLGDEGKKLTWSELEIAMGYLFYQEKGCDIAIWEIDDTRFQNMDGLVTLLQPIFNISDDMLPYIAEHIMAVKSSKGKQKFSFENYKNMEILQAGTYEMQNAAMALRAVNLIGEELGYSYTEQKIRKGMMAAILPGRFQVIGKKPVFILDGAEDAAEVKKLAESIQLCFPNTRLICIVGMAGDRSPRELIEPLLPMTEQFITVTIPNSSARVRKRVVTAYQLAEEIRELFPVVTAVDSLEEAAEISRLLVDGDVNGNKIVVATGSLSYLGKMSDILS